MEEEIPKVINHRYELEAKIGQGTLGIAYSAWDNVENRRVALKIIHREAIRRDMLGYLKFEFQAMSRLRHPNIIRVYDFDQISGTPMRFFTCEYVPGAEFTKATEELPWDEWYPLVVQACRALEFIHSRNILHCDLKPANLLVTRAPKGLVPKLMDFHLSKDAKVVTSKSIEGTIAYMSPEVINAAALDKRADLYSFGCLLYEAIAKRIPFQGESAVEILRAHLNERPVALRTLRPDVPLVFERIVARLLEKDPSDRYGSANEVIREIAQATGHEYALETPKTLESYVLSGRFVGRRAEMERLRSLLDPLIVPPEDKQVLPAGGKEVPGPFRLVLVGAPPGLGKTRLVREFRIQCQLKGISFYSGACVEETGKAFAPFLDILQAMARAEKTLDLPQDPGAAGILDARAMLLSQAEGKRPRSPGDTSLRERQVGVRDRVAKAILRVARATPVVLHFEDLHWADDETIETLEYLWSTVVRDEEGGKPPAIVICGTYRDGEIAGTPFGDWIRRLDLTGAVAARSERNAAEVILLPPLSETEARDFLLSMLGQDEVPIPLVRKMAEECGGSPLAIEELMKLLFEERVIVFNGEKWEISTERLARIRAPKGELTAFRQRVGKLDGATLEVLKVLSLCTAPIPLPVFEKISPFKGRLFFEVLRKGKSKGMIAEEDTGGEVRFSLAHFARRRVLRGALTRAEKARLHRRIGHALESLPAAQREDQVEALAYHYREAGPRAKRKALRYALAAGDRARRTLALRTALFHYRQASKLMEAARRSPRRLLDVYRQVGEIAMALGEFDRAKEVYDTALRSSGGRKHWAEFALLLGNVHEQKGEYAQALDCYEKSLGRIDETRTPAAAARVLLEIAWVRGYRMGQIDPSMDLCRKALETLETRGTAEDLFRGYTVLCGFYENIGDAERLLEYSFKVLQLRRDANDAEGMPRSYNNIGRGYVLQGDFEQSIAYLQQALHLMEHTEQPVLLATIHGNLASAFMGRGDWENARMHAQKSLEIAERLGDRRRLAVQLTQLGEIFHKLGDSVAAVNHLTRSALIAHGMGVKFHEETAILRLAEVYLDCGQIDEVFSALTRMEESVSGKTVLNVRRQWLEGRAWLEVRNHERARAMLEECFQGYDALRNRPGKANALVDLARLEAAEGEPRRARMYLSRALRLSVGAADKEIAARMNLTWGQVELEDGQGDLAVGLANAGRAVEKAEALGNPWILWEALYLVGRYQLRQGDPMDAAIPFRRAGTIVDSIVVKLPLTARTAFQARDRLRQFRDDMKTIEPLLLERW